MEVITKKIKKGDNSFGGDSGVKLSAWNVMSLRTMIAKPQFFNYVNKNKPDIIIITETKLQPEHVKSEDIEAKINKKLTEDIKDKYNFYYTFSTKKLGYSGVLVMSTEKALFQNNLLNNNSVDHEGRFIYLEFQNYSLISLYQPTSGARGERLEYRTEQFDKSLQKFIKETKKKSSKPIILGGDFNVANEPIDIHCYQKRHDKRPSFFIEEREGFKKLLKMGFTDSYRSLYKEKKQFTWWNQMFNCRTSNKGWRIDYFLVDNKVKDNIIEANIRDDIMGSDHCPVELIIKF